MKHLGWDTTARGAQAKPRIDHAKEVASRPHLGADTPGVRPHPTAAACARSPLAVACHHAEAVLAGFPFCWCQTGPISLYKRGLGSFTKHTSFGLHTSPLLVLSFHSFRSSCEQRQELQGELVFLKEEQHFGMNTMSSSKCKSSSLSYSNAYELEYSLDHLIIMIYELVYSLYATILTCSSSFFNIHIYDLYE
jgi:hypothetical protein